MEGIWARVQPNDVNYYLIFTLLSQRKHQREQGEGETEC